jgi:uncharacterized RDD family membrane protein YckC
VDQAGGIKMNMLAGVEYVGFWSRVGASIIDSILILLLTSPIVYLIYGPRYFTDNKQLIAGGWDFMATWVLPAVAVIVFWIYRSATPGKIILGMRIVDAETGGKPSTGQLIGRYFAYYVSAIPLSLGFLWIAFDKRKQGWHDKLAGTVVIEDDVLD